MTNSLCICCKCLHTQLILSSHDCLPYTLQNFLFCDQTSAPRATAIPAQSNSLFSAFLLSSVGHTLSLVIRFKSKIRGRSVKQVYDVCRLLRHPILRVDDGKIKVMTPILCTISHRNSYISSVVRDNCQSLASRDALPTQPDVMCLSRLQTHIHGPSRVRDC